MRRRPATSGGTSCSGGGAVGERRVVRAVGGSADVAELGRALVIGPVAASVATVVWV